MQKIYKIDKAPLFLALGFGEVTIPRYLEGQVPSKEYLDIVKAVLAFPALVIIGRKKGKFKPARMGCFFEFPQFYPQLPKFISPLINNLQKLLKM